MSTRAQELPSGMTEMDEREKTKEPHALCGTEFNQAFCTLVPASDRPLDLDASSD
jgi:hypothetical protein